MKKTIGILLILLLVASLLLVVTGVFQILRFSNDFENEDTDTESGEIDEITDDGKENTDNGEEKEDGDQNAENGDDINTNVTPEPEPEPEIGIQTEYTMAFEVVEGEELPSHMLDIVFDESALNTVSVKIYFGTLVSAENAQETENALVRISLRDENGRSLLIAELDGKDFYNDKYLCEASLETASVNYTRVIEMDIPSVLVGNDKGALTFELSVCSVDVESGVEIPDEKIEKNLYYKKTEGGYELSNTKESTVIYQYEYKTDISDYIGYIEPTGSLWSNDYLLLVNPWNPIEEGEEMTYGVIATQVTLGDIDEYNFYYRPSLKLNETAAKALTAMFNEALASGKFQSKNLQVVSSYRDYAWQESIYSRNVSNTKKYVCNNTACGHEYITKNSYTKCELCKSSVTKVAITLEEAQKQVSTYSCAPGTSEHQTGLTVDLADTTKSNAILEEPFKDTEAGKWLAENCAKFGFILRFEEDKEDITGIIYEPWHFRYVGRYHATRMTELGLCLEEYIELLNEEGYFEDTDSVHNPANMEIDEETLLIKGEKSN